MAKKPESEFDLDPLRLRSEGREQLEADLRARAPWQEFVTFTVDRSFGRALTPASLQALLDRALVMARKDVHGRDWRNRNPPTIVAVAENGRSLVHPHIHAVIAVAADEDHGRLLEAIQVAWRKVCPKGDSLAEPYRPWSVPYIVTRAVFRRKAQLLFFGGPRA